MSITATGGPESMRPRARRVALAASRRAFAAPAALASPTVLHALAPAREKTAGRRLLERFSTARQARIGHEVLVGVERLLARRARYAHGGAIGQDLPALLVVLEIGDHDLIEHLLMDGRIEDRAHDLDPPVEVARHQVGGSDIDRRLAMRQAVATAEAEDAAVLEEAANDGFHADIVRQSFDPRTQAADAAHDEVDLDARPRSLVERIDDVGV